MRRSVRGGGHRDDVVLSRRSVWVVVALIDPSLFVKGLASSSGRVEGGRRRRPVGVVASLSGPGVACAEAPVVRTLGRSRRLVESFPELPSRALSCSGRRRRGGGGRSHR